LTVVVWIGVIVLAGVAVVVLALKAPAAGIPLPSGAPRRRARAIEQRGFRAALVLLLLLPLLPLVTRPGTGGTPTIARSGGRTMVVMDVSGSISAPLSQAFARTLASLRDDDPRRRAGLVIFADRAHVVMPPTVSAADLAGFSRYFAARNLMRDDLARAAELFIPGLLPGSLTGSSSNPWASAWSGGTTISSGLIAADRALGRGSGGTVVLISDLRDGEDPGVLGDALGRLESHGRKLAIVGVGAAQADISTYVSRGALLVDHPRVTAATTRDRTIAQAKAAGSGSARALAVLLAAVALGAVIWWRTPLRLHPAAPRKALP